MAVDYIFGEQYSASFTSIPFATRSFRPDRLDAVDRIAYGVSNWAGQNQILTYDFNTESINQIGFPTGTSGGFIIHDIDLINNVIFVGNDQIPFVIYKIDLSNPSSAPLASVTATGGSNLRGLSYSTTSNRLAAITLNGSFIYDGDLNLITSLDAGVASSYCPVNNTFAVCGSNSDQVKFYNMSGSLLGSTSTLNLTSDGGQFFYCKENNFLYRVTFFNAEIINPTTYTRTAVYSLPITVTAGAIAYFDKVKQIFIATNPSSLTINTETGVASVLTNVSGDFNSMVVEPSTLKARVLRINTKTSVDLSIFESTLIGETIINIPAKLSGSSPTDDVYFPANNEAVVINTVNYFRLDRWLSAASSGSTEYTYSWTRNANTNATCGSNLVFSGDSQITGDFAIAMGASTTLTLGTRSNYTERFVIPPTGTILVRNNVTLTGFTLSAGTTIARAPGVTSPITVTVLNDPGLIAGEGVTIAAPQKTLTFTNVINDSELVIRISRSNQILFKGNVVGTSIQYIYNTSQTVDIAFYKEGYQTWTSRLFELPTSSQSIRVVQEISSAWRSEL